VVAGRAYVAANGPRLIGTIARCTMPRASPSAEHSALVAVRLLHTVVWAFFAGCIVAIPIAAFCNEHRAAAWLIAIVAVEVVVLLCNRWSCPLTAVAARHTDDRRANFDIYLPLWLARHNKVVFGVLYVAGVAFAAARWFASTT